MRKACLVSRTYEARIINIQNNLSGPGSSVGIAADCGLDGPGSNPGGDEKFPSVQTGRGTHPASCKMDTGSFLGVEVAGAWS